LCMLKEQHNLEVVKFDEESKQMGFATVFHNRERSNVSDVTSFTGGNSNLSRNTSQEHMPSTPFYSSGYGSSRPASGMSQSTNGQVQTPVVGVNYQSSGQW